MKSAKESWPPHPCEPEELGKTSAGYQTASIASYTIESSNHHFGVDFVLVGTEKTQSVFGSTAEMSIEEVDEILKVPGRPIEKRKRSIN
jgi:hypothetical protein